MLRHCEVEPSFRAYDGTATSKPAIFATYRGNRVCARRATDMGGPPANGLVPSARNMTQNTICAVLWNVWGMDLNDLKGKDTEVCTFVLVFDKKQCVDLFDGIIEGHVSVGEPGYVPRYRST